MPLFRWPCRLSRIIAGTLGAALLLLVTTDLAAAADDDPYDLLIQNGQVFDGTGNPAYYADVAIEGDRIAAVGQLDNASAERVIDAEGMHIAPGFIDIHSHADRRLDSNDERNRAAPSLVTQGITTVAVNQDGRSPWPLAPQMDTYEELGTGLNTIHMVGHGQVRSEVLGDDYERAATDEEIDEMRDLVREGMEQGAYGLTAGLEYTPGRWAETDEVVALVEEIVPYNGAYVSHQRAEGADPMWYWPSQHDPGPPNLIGSVEETVEIGERTGATVVASHIKAKSESWWGTSHAVIQMIERARDRGVDIWADQYSYRSTGTDGSTVLIPHWLFEEFDEDAHEDYGDLLEESLDDPDLRDDIHMDIEHEVDRRGGADDLLILDHPDEDYVGLTIEELADRYDNTAVEMAIQLQLEGDREQRGGARIRGFSMSEYDIESYMQQPWVMAASDGGIRVADEDDDFVHARFYGNFPRKIHEYAQERGVISVEDAIRSATSLPAQVLGLDDRGLVTEGNIADLVVMDLDRVEDKATFEEPHQYAEGMEYVLVNGRFVVDEGDTTWALPGRVLQNPEASR